MSTHLDPQLELISGYPRLTITPHRTRMSVPAVHPYNRKVFATVALIIRADLELRGGPIIRRWTGRPRIAVNGTVSIVLADRNFRHRHRITVTPADIAARLPDWAIA